MGCSVTTEWWWVGQECSSEEPHERQSMAVAGHTEPPLFIPAAHPGVPWGEALTVSDWITAVRPVFVLRFKESSSPFHTNCRDPGIHLGGESHSFRLYNSQCCHYAANYCVSKEGHLHKGRVAPGWLFQLAEPCVSPVISLLHTGLEALCEQGLKEYLGMSGSLAGTLKCCRSFLCEMFPMYLIHLSYDRGVCTKECGQGKVTSIIASLWKLSISGWIHWAGD